MITEIFFLYLLPEYFFFLALSAVMDNWNLFLFLSCNSEFYYYSIFLQLAPSDYSFRIPIFCVICTSSSVLLASNREYDSRVLIIAQASATLLFLASWELNFIFSTICLYPFSIQLLGSNTRHFDPWSTTTGHRYENLHASTMT